MAEANEEARRLGLEEGTGSSFYASPLSTSPHIPQSLEGTGLSKGLLPPGKKNSHLSESYYIPGSRLGPLIDIIS